ncbi:HD domain-containing phosphohydrolase [Herminiimonas fonticola]|uniref:HD-GYP domain-containing protein (C-di-GMP phosphodiesterase class II) n=1 Tax=Herminiimonas fonticola TaxID=303380 RepID=A0A4R6GI27_9BURK|nr:HD domain-containing phosphohydrolase [Herminiimonas fonticola]RBA25536.1 HD domain [Herminiimonas fonticola]TDN94649.1 HD-GYP domain-containing protein (c-di-GMP phosphodiesterase class II) [Herminiimonas fonticola]
MKFKFPLHIHLSTLFIVMTLVISGVIAGVGYQMSYDMLETSAQDLTQRASREIAGEINGIIGPANTTVELLSYHRLAYAETLEERMASFNVLQPTLNNASGMTSIFIGYASGDYLFLHRISSEEERIRYRAPAGSYYQLRSIERSNGNGEAKYIYLDADMQVLGEEVHPEYAAGFDPRQRGWYQSAMAANGTVTTKPYLFFSVGQVGLTVAQRSQDGHAVIAVDIPLLSLGAVLQRQKVTPSSQLTLVSADGNVVAYEDLKRLIATPTTANTPPALKNLKDFGIPPLAGLAGSITKNMDPEGISRSVEIDGEDWRVSVLPIPLEGAESLYLMTAIPKGELFATALKIRSTSILVTLLIILIAIPLIWLVSRFISKSIRVLANEAESIRRFKFDEPIRLRSSITEVNSLAETMDVMKNTIRKFISITHAVAAETDFEKLLPMLLNETIAAGGAQSGALYLVDGDKLLPCTAVSCVGEEVSRSLQTLRMDALPALLRTALDRQQAQDDMMNADEIEAAGLNALCEKADAAWMVAVPLFNRQHELLGLMLLKRKTRIDATQLAFVGALSDSASSSMETRGLIHEQKALFEAFIQLIAGAIDAKSPYTGGHCARVPELTKMLARAACIQDSGPYADFDLSKDEWEAVHVAAWLHDCGKVTTPEYVVDKATKLETIYDRIHEVRMRFEVLKRDAEIDCLRAIASGENKDIAEGKLAEKLRELDEEFAFIATCNEGGEFMAPERVERLQKIAERTWLRTLDDALGISYEEKRRKSGTPVTPLPVTESLLADKPEHLFERRAQDKIAADNKWNFRMKVPELLYNRGEVYNLSVSRGTLSEEERYKINEHMIQTVIMLSQLPFPRHLRHVPEIAGGHHEKMNGTGYPKMLKKEDMSPVARMMAIADIFEALTAADRPYKKGKTLSEALKIMSFMSKDQHIDDELFELFLRSGVYMEYAQCYMAAEQIDEVDINTYLDKPVVEAAA